uniref:Exonuclease domain-containing protein n=1 Tax=viral metagenome TaxID=1070528 RepID=A0A6C0KEE1_9ZZZZ
MKFLIFDTETTGLPRDFGSSAFKGPNNWPHIVSISWAIMDEKCKKVLSSQSYIIKPRGWEIPFESSLIHGITTSEATEYGHDLAEVMDKFFSETCDAYVAHNMHFDRNVIYNAMIWDLGYEYFGGLGKPKLCTMQIGRTICKLPKNKSPKLSELYEHCTGKKPNASSLHNSLHDTLFLCEAMSSSPEIRIDLIKSYDKQVNEGRENVTPVIQEAEALGSAGDKGANGSVV